MGKDAIDLKKMSGGGFFSVGSLLPAHGQLVAKGSKRASNRQTIGQFTGNMVRAIKVNSAEAQGIYYMVGEGDKGEGGGRMSKAMAESAVLWVRSVLAGRVFDEQGLGPRINRTERYDGPDIEESRSDSVQKWIDQTPQFREKGVVSYRSGTMAEAIKAIATKQGGFAVGISANEYTSKNPVFLSSPLRYQPKPIAVGTYAMWQETGAGTYPARPWISGSMVAWIRTFDTVWADLAYDLFDTVLWDTINDTKGTMGTGGLSGESVEEQINAAGRVAMTQGTAPSAEAVYEAEAKKVKKAAVSLDAMVKNTLAAYKASSNKLGAVAFKKSLVKTLKGHLKSSEINTILKAIPNN